MESFRKKIFNEAEEIASLNMGVRNQYSSSLRAGSLVPRTGEARKSVGKARKSEPARELLIFEFRPSRGVKSAFHMCQII